MSQPVIVVFYQVKAGNTDPEWEDCAGHDSNARGARCIVVDGATEAYDSVRWVGQLVESFLGIDELGATPRLTRKAMDDWFRIMQDRWVANAPATFSSIFEERKFREDGSFATLLACELNDLDGPQPRWIGAALGDTVLFHVRECALVTHFPDLGSDDFGLNPDGVFTQPSARERMRSRLLLANGDLAVGDHLFMATDAIAEWMVRRSLSDGPRFWRVLCELDSFDEFQRIVADRRRSGEMKNDDVTLMRVEITASDPDILVVGQ